ncbi:MAG: NAD(P)/FAD-dependent oxidoreductase [Campylobacterales bacterium]|nr:NAD(P)/FAD-dependent oxidoreductase [Campylobacterales bacterium]
MKSVTIIGAGLGGLTAGALLAKEGYKVTILEQHNIVGGCATTFKRKGGFICEVGLHEMDGVYSNPTLKTIFEMLDVYNHIEFIQLKEFFKITTKKGEFIMPHGIQEAKKALKSYFAGEDDAIDRYFALIERIYYEISQFENLKWYQYPILPFLIRHLLKYKNKSVTEVMNELTDNKELRLILNSNLQYYNDLPETLSFLLHAVAQYSYYLGGGYFIKGGSGELSDYFAKVITDNGGEVITKALVTKARGNSVEYMHKKEHKRIESDLIVSNLSPQDTYTLFGENYHETKEIANSLLTVYIGFNKNLKEVYGEGVYSHFIADDMDSLCEFSTMMQRDITQHIFAFTNYAQIDSALAPSGKSFGVVCMGDYLENWADMDKESYHAKKQQLQDAVIAKLEKYYPKISQYVEYIETGTAKTMLHYTKTPHGTAYGYKPTPKQFLRMPQVKSNKIKNLYFVGQWVIAGGFSPAISSGYLAYQAIKKG